jgi:hypothetical protein
MEQPVRCLNVQGEHSVKRLFTSHQIIGREGETATFLSRCLLTLNLCGGGFAPRQFGR